MDALDTERPTWGDHETALRDRLQLRWIVSTWAFAILVGAGIALAASMVVAGVTESSLVDETSTQLGVAAIIGAMSTFIAFATVTTLRLVQVPHHRLVNALAVGVLHVAVSIALVVLEFALEGVGAGASDVLGASWSDDVGTVFSTFERSSAAAILGCLLSAGMVPATGDRPSGTQTGPTEQDRQM